MLARGLVLTSFAVVLGSVVACVGGPGSLPGQAIGEEASAQGGSSSDTSSKGGASDTDAPPATGTSSNGGSSTPPSTSCVVGASCSGCPTNFVGTVSACDGDKATCRCVSASARDGG